MFDLPFKFLTNIIVNYSIKTLKKEFEEILKMKLEIIFVIIREDLYENYFLH